MSAGEHKALNRRFFEEGLNNKHLAILEEHTDVDLVAHHPTGTTQGLLAFKQALSAYFTAFPDLHFTIEAQIAEGDLSVVHWTARGTHQGIRVSAHFRDVHQDQDTSPALAGDQCQRQAGHPVSPSAFLKRAGSLLWWAALLRKWHPAWPARPGPAEANIVSSSRCGTNRGVYARVGGG